MRYFIYTTLTVVLLALNMQAERLFYGSPVRLNLLILPLVFAAVELQDRTHMFFAFASGLALDFYSSSPFGSFLFSFIFVGAFLNWVAKTFWANQLNFKSVFVFSAVGILASGILAFGFASVLPATVAGTALSFKPEALKVFSNLVFGLVAAVPVFALWRFVLRIIAKTESKRIILGS
ncbi:MAG: rod shape-determining protein MreD [Candidatus Doudnabacteria bacterium]|nr:rod shape-determining protein MreD [Candidatus Doudnabacteria bacterium]